MISKSHKNIQIGKYLRKYRMQNRYSQEEVADSLGISQKTYSNMENDKSQISLETITKLVDLYKIDVTKIDFSKFISDGKLLEVKENHSHDTSNGIVINGIGDDIKEHYVEIISNYKTIVEEKNKRITELETLLLSK